MFEDYNVLVLRETSGAAGLVEALQKHGARAEALSNPSINEITAGKFNHVISATSDFAAYMACRRALIPVTTPEWIWESLRSSKPCTPNKFSPDPHLFMKDVFVCAADNLHRGDKEAIYGAVAAFGGYYLDDLTKYTTHLVATDLRNVKSIIAANVVDTPDEDGHIINIKIVSPRWIDACISLGSVVEELDYILHKADETASDSQHQVPVSQSGPIAKRTVFCGYSSPLLVDLLKHHGAIVKDEYDPNIDICLIPHKSGPAYDAAAKSKHTVIGTLLWIYAVLAAERWQMPSNLLHFPVPALPPAAFAGLRISITNYSGEARTYLSKLIVGLGGEFTKTLTRSNQYLIAGSPSGKKYITATERWTNSEGRATIQVVNHLWLEKCYASWSLVDSNNEEFAPGTTVPMGSYEEDAASQQNESSQALPLTPITSPGDTRETSGKQETIKVGKDAPGTVKDSANTDKDTPKLTRSTQKARISQENDQPQPSNPHSARKSRSAAQKAAEKLHADMDDLNNYQKISKSSRSMKSYMEALDQANTKRSVEEPAAENPSKKKKGDAHVNAIITGSEDEISLNRQDLAKLAQVGIKVNKELSPAHRIGVIIAPRILRTQKFLTSLSQVDHIVHPQYLVDILKAIKDDSNWTLISKEFNMDNYSLDKVMTKKEVNEELGITGSTNGLSQLLSSPNKGKVFAEIPLNLSGNLNGGVDVVGAILASHGLAQHAEIKALTRRSQLVGDTPVLVAHATKDKKLVTSFKRICPEGVAVTWDWCVRSIFAMRMLEYEPYELN